jgi:YggT family protein
MRALFWLLDTAINLYVWALIIAAVLSMLIAFNVLDTRNRFVWAVGDFFYRITEPALRPIRRRLPNLGGVDLSPLVLILVLQALRILLATSIAPALGVHAY